MENLEVLQKMMGLNLSIMDFSKLPPVSQSRQWSSYINQLSKEMYLVADCNRARSQQGARLLTFIKTLKQTLVEQGRGGYD
jgi:hypothetical protein